MAEDEVDGTSYELSERFYEVDPFGYPLDPETRRRRALVREMWEEQKKWSREQVMAYLVKLGTHNPDGTLTEAYADNGEPSKHRPTD